MAPVASVVYVHVLSTTLTVVVVVVKPLKELQSGNGANVKMYILVQSND